MVACSSTTDNKYTWKDSMTTVKTNHNTPRHTISYDTKSDDMTLHYTSLCYATSHHTTTQYPPFEYFEYPDYPVL